MYLEVPDYLTPEEVSKLISLAQSGTFADGLATARSFSRQHKHNLQLDPTAEQSAQVDGLMRTAFQRSTLAREFTQANEARTPILSRYEEGMYYKSHFDAPFLTTKSGALRTDLSMTVFLSHPEDYAGGSLVLETEFGDIECKPAAGTAVIYSTLLRHEVETVTQGVRLAIVTWFQSRVRDPLLRNTLFDLSLALHEVQAAAPESEAARRLQKSVVNLAKLLSD